MSHLLEEVRSQAAGIHQAIESLREVSAAPPFDGELPTLDELLALRRNCEEHLAEEADWHIPIYLGQRIIEELDGYWSVDERPNSAHRGQVYVDGFGGIDHEYVFLSQLRLQSREDLVRVRRTMEDCRKTHGLRERFREEFRDLAGEKVPRPRIEERCVELGILPDPERHRMRYRVEKKRVTVYCRELKIELSRK